MIELAPAIEAALKNETKAAELFRRLELGSGLPGPRINLPLALAFAQDCALFGAKGEALALRLANVPPNEARGASTKEFLSVCGVLAYAIVATPERALVVLEERADDPRFRVRDAVPLALAGIGKKLGPELAERVAPWTDRYFQAAAVLLALANPIWLETFAVSAPEQPLARAREAFLLARNAPRSAFRYPGHKALVDALSAVPRAFAKRFGVPVFDELASWTDGLEAPELRAAILQNLEDSHLKKRFGPGLDRVRAGVEGSKKPPRDPTRLIQGMRGRGKKRAKR